jgi:hypothetical protein
MLKQLKLISDCGDSGSNKWKRGSDDASGSVLAKSALDESLESGSRFCVVAFGRNLASVAITMFYRQTSFINEFNKFCTFYAICKHDAAINYFTDDHKEVSF